MKIRPVGAELFYVEGRTDGRTERHDEAKINFFAISCLQLKTSFIKLKREPQPLRLQNQRRTKLWR